MSLDPRLLELLRCPADRAKLEYQKEPERLVCTVCGRRYAVLEGGIPNMLLDDAEEPGDLTR